MKYSLAFNVLMTALLVLSLASKLQIKTENSDFLREHIVRFLESQRFEVVESNESLEGLPTFRAKSGDCQMSVMRASSLGWNRYMIQGIAADGDSFFFVFEGRVYTEQPTWQSTVSYRWSRLLRELGIRQHASYVLAVVANASCRAESLPWGEFSSSEDAGS
jgi:hypothetical protein